MDANGFVVPPGGGSILSMGPGRSVALKLLGSETGDSFHAVLGNGAGRHRDRPRILPLYSGRGRRAF